MFFASVFILLTGVALSEGRVLGQPLPTLHNSDASNRIFGGKETIPHAYPFMVSVQLYEDELPLCGGSLLNDRYILTAAHCIYYPKDNVDCKPEDVYVMLGEHNVFKDDGQIKRDVDKIIRHKVFPNGESPFDSDIALLRLSEPIEFGETISPICLSARQNLTKERPTVIGWGQTPKWYLPEVLSEVDVPVLEDSWCVDAYHKNYYAPHMVCAGYPLMKGYKDICRGDSGGPLFLNPPDGKPSQIGIVSFNSAFGCALLHYPSAYTKVAAFKSWIETNVEGSVCFMP